jgi:hypothetical protein
VHCVQSQVVLFLEEVLLDVFVIYFWGWVKIISIAFSKEFLASVSALIAWDYEKPIPTKVLTMDWSGESPFLTFFSYFYFYFPAVFSFSFYFLLAYSALIYFYGSFILSAYLRQFFNIL